MSEPIHLKQTLPIRGRPEVLYRLVMDPARRAKWDSNIESAAYESEGQRLSNNAVVNFKLPRRYLGLKFQAKYSHVHLSRSGTWESLGTVGPLEKLSQQWQFKAFPGGTEVTLSIDAAVKYKWVRSQVERTLHNMLMSTLLDLQRTVDVQGAQLMQELGKEMQAKQKAEAKAAKAAKRGK